MSSQSFNDESSPGNTSSSQRSSGEAELYISDNVAGHNRELTEVVVETVKNIRNYLSKSDKSYFDIIPNVNVRDYTFHASAFIYDSSNGVINISAGIFYSIIDVCSMLTHRTEFMADWLPPSEEHRLCLCPKCLNERNFNGWLVDYSWLVSDNPNTTKIFNPMVGSLTPTPRSVIGGFLILRCTYWICAHEIGHLLLDHILHLESHHATVKLPGTESIKNLHHVLEIEADTFATCLDIHIGDVVEQLKRRMANAKAQSLYTGPWPQPTEEIATRILQLVPYIIGMLLYVVNRNATASHPYPKFRFRLSTAAFSEVVTRRNQGHWLTPTNVLLDDYAKIAATCIPNQDAMNELLKDFFLEDNDNSYEELLNEIKKFQGIYGTWKKRMRDINLFEEYKA